MRRTCGLLTVLLVFSAGRAFAQIQPTIMGTPLNMSAFTSATAGLGQPGTLGGPISLGPTPNGISPGSTFRSSTGNPIPSLRGRDGGLRTVATSRNRLAYNAVQAAAGNRNLANLQRIRQQRQQRRQQATQAIRTSAASARRTKHSAAHRLTLGFAETMVPAHVENVRVRTIQLRDRLQLPDLEINVEGGTAVVQGSVGDQEQKSLVSRVLLLEPGIESVDNRLVIRPRELELP
ncbi:MAG: BON domain-containing protein [Planctomycetota bacterium]